MVDFNNAKVLEKQLDKVTNTTMVAMVTNASSFVHNDLIGATIVASDVYLYIYSHHGETPRTINTTSFKHFSIKTNVN